MASKSERMARQEQEILCNLVLKYQDVIECKRSDAESVTSKARCWQKVTDEFNNHGCVSQVSRHHAR